ncbi:hypothetical protein [Haloferula sp. BvORR071]|uniref:beta strand repeat-containing protein n=1 Tax=Haloferula sp. BvORR071 TaxID=1396141 RepID=UPI00054DA609|nr:hypothetical protein [Haloferula sp. BvORR071]
MKSKHIAFHATLAIAFTSAHAAERWWDGGTIDITNGGNGFSNGGAGTWNASVLNWDQGTASSHGIWDNGGSGVAIFGGAGGTVTQGSPITVNRLVFEYGATYVMADAVGNSLTFAGDTPSIVAKGGVSWGTTSVASKTTFEGTAGLTITGAAVTSAGATAVVLNSASAHPLTGGFTFKNGVTFNPSVRLYTGTTDLLNPNNALTFDGGHFTLSGFAGKTIDQTLGNASFNTLGAGSRLFVTTSGSNASTTTKLHLGTISGSNLTTKAAGGLLTGLGSPPIAGTTHAITTTTAPTQASNNTYGPRVIYTMDGGAASGDWTTATDLGGGVYQLAPYAGYTPMADDGTVNNLDVSLASDLVFFADNTRGTLKIANNGKINMDAFILTLNRGGLITSGSTATTVSGLVGATCLTAGAGSSYELIVHPYNSAGTTISAVIGDNPNGTLFDPIDDIPVSLTINNLASNPLTLSGLNTHSGVTTINGSSTLVDGKSSVIALFDKNKTPAPSEADPEPLRVASALGTADSVTLNGAVIQILASGSGTSNRDLSVSGNSGFYVKGNYTETLAGVISGTGTFSTDGDFGGSNGGTGNVVLAGANTFSGDFIFRSDARFTLAHADAMKNATLDLSGQRILADLKTNNLSYNIGGLRGNVSAELGTGGATKTVTIGGNGQSNTYAGVLSGDSGLTKTGTGTQILLGANTYGSVATGSTVVAEGSLKLGSVGSSIINGTGSSGQKTITALSGTAGLVVGQAVSGGNVGVGAVITSIDTATQVTVNVAHSAAFSAVPITFGAVNAAIATPAIEVKTGATLDVASQPAAYVIAAPQTLGGAGSVVGPVSVSGKLSPGVASSPDATVLLPDLDNSTATLTTGDVSFAATGEYKCTLGAADSDKLAAANLIVVPGAKISFSGTPAAASYLLATYTGVAPLPFATDASLPAGYSLDYTTPGQIKLVGGGGGPAPYDTWTSAKGLSGTDAAAAADPDHDGLSNAIEFVIGGEPNPANAGAESSALAPTITTTDTHLVFTFRRTDTALTQPGIAITAAYSSSLGGWTTAQNGVNGVTIVVTDDGFGAGVDKVEVSIPKTLANGSRIFARLNASF